MSVMDHEGLPSEGGDARLISFQVPAVHGLSPLPQAVNVKDPYEVVQLVVGGDLHGLPLRALRHFAVSEEHVGPVRKLVQVLPVQGHSKADGQALPQGTGGGLRVSEGHGGMTFQGASEFPVRHHLLVGHLACSDPQGIEKRRGVALGKDETVVVGMLRLIRVIAKDPADEVGCPEPARVVARRMEERMSLASSSSAAVILECSDMHDLLD